MWSANKPVKSQDKKGNVPTDSHFVKMENSLAVRYLQPDNLKNVTEKMMIVMAKSTTSRDWAITHLPEAVSQASPVANTTPPRRSTSAKAAAKVVPNVV